MERLLVWKLVLLLCQNKMINVISFAMVGTNDLRKAGEFYDAVLSQIGLTKITSVENRYIGYGHSKCCARWH